MPGLVAVGAQWGDEGKGKYVDWLAAQADWVVRHQGGNNAGHTVFVGQEQYVLHLLPSGVIHPKVRTAIGAGVVIDPQVLVEEMDSLAARGVEISPQRVMISPNAHVIMPWHRLMDGLMEDRSGDKKVGTTRRGIGPAYADKAARLGLRLADLTDPIRFAERLRAVVAFKNEVIVKIFNGQPFEYEQVLAEYQPLGRCLAPYLGDVSATLYDGLRAGKRVLFEGAQGTLLDIDYGTYPYVTSSNTIAAGACTGLGLAPYFIDRVLGVAKAYTTRVGEGPFPTEAEAALGNQLRTAGPVGEFGATTGRPRRCGWFDGPLVRRAVIVNGITELALTRLDVLSEFETIPVCVGYNFQGRKIATAPEDLHNLGQCQPEYQNLRGWRTDLAGTRDWEALPAAARDYVSALEELTGAPIALISVGPQRDQTIVRTANLWTARQGAEDSIP